jgi:hypothetical protein
MWIKNCVPHNKINFNFYFYFFSYYLRHGFVFEKKNYWIISYVSTNVNLHKILKYDLGYREPNHIKTFPYYWDWFQKYVFKMIKQFGLAMFFVTFTTSVNNWLMMTLKNLHTQHFNENILANNDNSLINRDFIRNNHITCVWYYAHRMNNFCKLLKNTNVLFDNVKDYAFITKFQSKG